MQIMFSLFAEMLLMENDGFEEVAFGGSSVVHAQREAINMAKVTMISVDKTVDFFILYSLCVWLKLHFIQALYTYFLRIVWFVFR